MPVPKSSKIVISVRGKRKGWVPDTSKVLGTSSAQLVADLLLSGKHATDLKIANRMILLGAPLRQVRRVRSYTV
jgi:hypothetical protein